MSICNKSQLYENIPQQEMYGTGVTLDWIFEMGLN